MPPVQGAAGQTLTALLEDARTANVSGSTRLDWARTPYNCHIGCMLLYTVHCTWHVASTPSTLQLCWPFHPPHVTDVTASAMRQVPCCNWLHHCSPAAFTLADSTLPLHVQFLCALGRQERQGSVYSLCVRVTVAGRTFHSSMSCHCVTQKGGWGWGWGCKLVCCVLPIDYRL
jgi:hypothetical protein